MAEKLAIDGGPKAVSNTLVGWPNFSEEAIQSVVAVLRSGKVNYWTGPRGMEFEKKFAAWQGSGTPRITAGIPWPRAGCGSSAGGGRA